MTPESAAGPPPSKSTMCDPADAITSSPGRQCTAIAISLHIVPEGRNTESSLPSSAHTRSRNRFVVGSSNFCSSPTSALAIARRISSVGRVLVSLKRSIIVAP